MSQISPPIRIVLVASIAFLAVWMLFLRPKPVEAPAADSAAATAPAVAAGGAKATTPVGKAVESANNAAARADQRAEALAGGVSDTATAPSTAAATAPATAPATQPATSSSTPTYKGSKAARATAKGMPLPVLRAIADHKVLVILFWNSRAADDRAVRREVAKVDRHHGKVFVHVAPISKIARYQQITRGVDVEQSPTIVVVDRTLQADALVGYNDAGTIDQAVADALRAKPARK